jgi:hypothetical protein
MRGPPRSVCDNWDATNIKFNIAKGPELKLKKLSRDCRS